MPFLGAYCFRPFLPREDGIMNLFVIIVAAILLALFIRKRPGMALRLLALLLLAFVLWAVIHSRTGLPPSEMRGR